MTQPKNAALRPNMEAVFALQTPFLVVSAFQRVWSALRDLVGSALNLQRSAGVLHESARFLRFICQKINKKTTGAGFAARLTFQLFIIQKPSF